MDEVTIYDIAKKAGVSASTVSRVLNNYEHVKDKTRERVVKALEESNFILNETARNLATQTSRMIGILIADLRTTHHTDGVYFIEREFSKNGYASIIYNTGADPERQAGCIRLLSRKKIDGLVMMGSIYQNMAVSEAIKTYLPSVPIAICNGHIDGENIYSIITDERGGVEESVKLLARKGHKGIAFISDHMTPSNAAKVRGFQEGFSKYVDNGKGIIIDAEELGKDIATATSDMIESNPDVSAIIYSEDYVALIGIHEIIKMGKRIPEDIAVVGINNSRFGEISNPSLTTIDNTLYDMSMLAVSNLLRVFAGDNPEKQTTLATKIIERDST